MKGRSPVAWYFINSRGENHEQDKPIESQDVIRATEARAEKPASGKCHRPAMKGRSPVAWYFINSKGENHEQDKPIESQDGDTTDGSKRAE